METAQSNPQKKRVLIVEDDLELVQIYEHLLGGFQYDVTIATDGALALKRILAQDMDAILCDLRMPELDGDLFFSAVERAKPHLCNRFIFITGAVDDPKYQLFLKQVKSPVLRKPVHPAQLIEELRRLLAAQN
jgi:two-component system, NtrC family, sensor kinase